MEVEFKSAKLLLNQNQCYYRRFLQRAKYDFLKPKQLPSVLVLWVSTVFRMVARLF